MFLAMLILGCYLIAAGGAFQHTSRTLIARDDLERACERSGLTQKQIAAALDVDDAQWTRQRRGEMGQPGVYRLAECPELEAEYLMARAARHGLIVLPQNQIGLAMEAIVRLVTSRKRMARAKECAAC